MAKASRKHFGAGARGKGAGAGAMTLETAVASRKIV